MMQIIHHLTPLCSYYLAMTILAPNFSLELVTTLEGLHALKEPWRQLFRDSKTSSFSLSWEWSELWWKIFSNPDPGADELMIITAWSEQRLIAVLPLYIEHLASGARCLRFLSTSVNPARDLHPEYLDILQHGEIGIKASRRIALMLHSSAVIPWDLLCLDRLTRPSPLITASKKLYYLRGFRKQFDYICPFADLQKGFENYLSCLSTNSRSRFKRLLNKGAASAVQLSISDSEEEAITCMTALMDEHQHIWQQRGEPGAFQSPEKRLFHLNLCKYLLKEKRVIVANASQNGDTFARLYGFVSGHRFEFYQSAIRYYDEKIPLKSPGVLAHLLLMKELCHRGIHEYDFLAGESDYKMRLATGFHQIEGLHLFRPSINTMLEASSRVFRHIRKKSGVNSPF